MSDGLLVIASVIEVERPVEVVRAHFCDIDHAMRSGLYSGVTLRWLAPKAPGERRLRQESRALGAAQSDEVLVEVSSDGGLVKRFVEGSNAGAVYRYAFEQLGDARTRVVVAVTTPASGLRRALGPLFKLAVKTAIARQLAEHKRDLEGGFEPGRARGNVSAALAVVRETLDAALSAGAAPRGAVFAPLIEAACLTAVSDGEVDDAERDALRSVVQTLGVSALDDDAVEAIVASSLERSRVDGYEKRCQELGARLGKLGLGGPGVAIAALVAQISHGLDPHELDTLHRLATAAGLDDDALAALMDRIDDALSKPSPSARPSARPSVKPPAG